MFLSLNWRGQKYERTKPMSAKIEDKTKMLPNCFPTTQLQHNTLNNAIHHRMNMKIHNSTIRHKTALTSSSITFCNKISKESILINFIGCLIHRVLSLFKSHQLLNITDLNRPPNFTISYG